MITITIILRPLLLPDDYEQLAGLLNQVWSEPTSAERLLEDDQKLYEVGHTWMDENGLLAGYDRERQVAVNEQGEIVGYIGSWRAPWTEPGHLCNTLIVAEAYRKQGIGQRLLLHIGEWALKLGATMLLAEVWDDNEDAQHFASRRAFAKERHAFQSLLQLDNEEGRQAAFIPDLPAVGDLRFLTLADEPGEASELKLYELYKETLVDIPGFMGNVPVIDEWRKWYLNLKIKAIQLAKHHGASYLRTDNDSTNAPILRINRKLGYVPLRGSYRLLAPLDEMLASLHSKVSK
ncbi:GNAT family N-acetyltransferase [Paenibacillus sp. LHD-38]|uniref:GNAT family N-acetyltransferase n=1 Tax=Paenibacillus sp. LHD-38 TaxID=3072143 RepID=UPI00280CDA23|nr:GNAT family N-acetyltransferase [Paenibacillus sp. LHD-38]MDQ8737551.1 GNAT family N-acetyltransferase [Paenibacillus sp. LHD-38]